MVEALGERQKWRNCLFQLYFPSRHIDKQGVLLLSFGRQAVGAVMYVDFNGKRYEWQWTKEMVARFITAGIVLVVLLVWALWPSKTVWTGKCPSGWYYSNGGCKIDEGGAPVARPAPVQQRCPAGTELSNVSGTCITTRENCFARRMLWEEGIGCIKTPFGK